MLKDWNSYSNVHTKHNDKLVSRVFKGIPDSMRNQAWHKLLEIESQIKAQSGVYEVKKSLLYFNKAIYLKEKNFFFLRKCDY